MLIEGPPGPHGPAVSILLKRYKLVLIIRHSCLDLKSSPACGALTERSGFRVFQVPQGYKDPQAPLEVMVTG